MELYTYLELTDQYIDPNYSVTTAKYKLFCTKYFGKFGTENCNIPLVA